jgi:hypothetical protein
MLTLGKKLKVEVDDLTFPYSLNGRCVMYAVAEEENRRVGHTGW